MTQRHNSFPITAGEARTSRTSATSPKGNRA